MIRDQDQECPIMRHRLDTAIAEREFFRKAYHDEIRSYNKVVEDRDNMLEELCFLRTELGEARWLELAAKYERLNCEALVVKAGCVRRTA